jgi:lipopolysaccharide transport system permease protein
VNNEPGAQPVTRIEPPSGWQLINFRELVEYRELFLFLVWRDIKGLYAQTIMGLGWAILQPLIQIVIFTIIFGKVAKVDTGGIPYFLFSTVAVIPWTYMSTAMASSSMSLVSSQGMLGKIYIPRLIFPTTPVLSKLLDFSISLVLLVGVMIFYQVPLTGNIVFFPVFLIMMVAVPLTVGLWLSSLAIRFRDIKFMSQFVIRMLMFTAPIVYSATEIPADWRLLYSLNPLVGVIEGMRASLLGTPLEWQYILPGMTTTALLLWGGMKYFKRMERIFSDVI